MHITPLDIQQKRFRTAMRGLDRAEVDAFLNIVASEFEKITSESNLLRDDQHRSKKLIEEYRERERSLKETMITAQRVTEEIKENAKKEADIILGRAELEAEKIIENAQDRLTELLGDIAELKRQRAQFIAQLKGVVDTHHKLLRIAEEDDEREHKVEDNLAVMRRPAAGPSATSNSAAQGPVPTGPQPVEESGSTEVPRQDMPRQLVR